MMTWQTYGLALLKSFPLGIVVIAILVFGIYETIEDKWERRGENAR
ncbi:MAG: hypothetical protein GX053_12680 [Tissierella sp.]|nr:hypothetical protein [Tissierella sp.]